MYKVLASHYHSKAPVYQLYMYYNPTPSVSWSMCFGRILNIIKHIYFTLITNLSLFFQHVTYLLPYLKSYFINLICFHAFNAFCNPLYIHLTCSDHCTPPRHTHQSDRPYAFMDSLSWIRVSVCLVEPQHHRQWASLCPSC